MSSALAMVLTAAMAVPANGPEKVSGEMKQDRLDLSGKWAGTITYEDNETDRVTLEQCELVISSKWMGFGCSWKMKDEGQGKFRCNFLNTDYLGIYKWWGDTVVLCIRPKAKGRPISFRAGDGQDLLILHRVKPRK